jgi:hypothetical protein
MTDMPQTGGAIKRPKPKKSSGGRPRVTEDSYARKIETRGAATTASRKVAKQYAKAARKSSGTAAITTKSTRKSDNKYLIKASGTTKGEVQGVRAALKTGRFTKKQAVKALNESGSKKRVRKALSR